MVKDAVCNAGKESGVPNDLTLNVSELKRLEVSARARWFVQAFEIPTDSQLTLTVGDAIFQLEKGEGRPG